MRIGNINLGFFAFNILVVAALSSGSSASRAADSGAVETREFPAQDIKAVEVANGSGEVSIAASSAGGKATVRATKNAFADKCKLTIDKRGSVLLVKVEESGWGSDDCDVDLDIRIPKAVNLDIAEGSGRLEIKGIEGELNFKMGSGDVVADGVFRRVDGRSGSGRIDIKGLVGGGELRTGSGAVDLSFAKTELKGEFDLKSGSGNATLRFAKKTKIKTVYRVGSGELTNELGDHPDAPFRVSMQAGSGNLNIRAY